MHAFAYSICIIKCAELYRNLTFSLFHFVAVIGIILTNFENENRNKIYFKKIDNSLFIYLEKIILDDIQNKLSVNILNTLAHKIYNFVLLLINCALAAYIAWNSTIIQVFVFKKIFQKIAMEIYARTKKCD